MQPFTRITRPIRRARAVALSVVVLTAILPAACGMTDPAGSGPVDRGTFVAVNVELRRAARTASDSAEFAQRKRRILERHAVTAEELERFVERHAGEVGYLAELWGTINARVSAPDEDSVNG